MILRSAALVAVVVVTFARPASAGIPDALDAVQAASDINDADASRCQGKLAGKLDGVIDALRGARGNLSARAVKNIKKKVKAAADVAEDRCPDRVGAPVLRKLDDVLDAIEDTGGDDNTVDVERPATSSLSVKIGQIKVGDGELDGRAVVVINPRNIVIKGGYGRNVFFAVGVAPGGSNQYEWSQFDASQIAYDPAEWKDAGTFRFFHDWLTEHDTSDGKFNALFVIYDNDTKAEIGRKEIGFNFHGGPRAMSQDAYDSLLGALRGTRIDFNKRDLLRDTIASQWLSAAQLGPILDEFTNELIRLDAAKIAVPRVLDPNNALVHANKFRNSILAGDYTALITGR